MRRKSERNKSKASPEKKPAETSSRKTRRYSRRRKRSSSRSSNEESDEVTQQPVEILEPEVSPPSDDLKKSGSNSDEDNKDQAVWKVEPANSTSGEIQKLKICLQRPPTTPEKIDRSPRRRRNKMSSQSDDTPEEKPVTKRRLRRGSPSVSVAEDMSQDSSKTYSEKDECLIIDRETNVAVLGEGKLEFTEVGQETEHKRSVQDSRTGESQMALDNAAEKAHNQTSQNQQSDDDLKCTQIADATQDDTVQNVDVAAPTKETTDSKSASQDVEITKDTEEPKKETEIMKSSSINDKIEPIEMPAAEKVQESEPKLQSEAQKSEPEKQAVMPKSELAAAPPKSELKEQKVVSKSELSDEQYSSPKLESSIKVQAAALKSELSEQEKTEAPKSKPSERENRRVLKLKTSEVPKLESPEPPKSESSEVPKSETLLTPTSQSSSDVPKLEPLSIPTSQLSSEAPKSEPCEPPKTEQSETPKSEAMKSEPSVSKSEPSAMESEPSAMDSDTSAMETEPSPMEALKSEPVALISEPSALKSEPSVMKLEPSEAPKSESPEPPKSESPKAPKSESPKAPKSESPEAPKLEPSDVLKSESPEVLKSEPSEAPKSEPSEAPKLEPSEALKLEPSEAPKSESSMSPKSEISETEKAKVEKVEPTAELKPALVDSAPTEEKIQDNSAEEKIQDNAEEIRPETSATVKAELPIKSEPKVTKRRTDTKLLEDSPENVKTDKEMALTNVSKVAENTKEMESEGIEEIKQAADSIVEKSVVSEVKNAKKQVIAPVDVKIDKRTPISEAVSLQRVEKSNTQNKSKITSTHQSDSEESEKITRKHEKIYKSVDSDDKDSSDSKNSSDVDKTLQKHEKSNTPEPLTRYEMMEVHYEDEVVQRVPRKRKWGKYKAENLVTEHITMDTILKFCPNVKMLREDELKMEAEEVKEKKVREDRKVYVKQVSSSKEEEPEKEVSRIGLNRKISIVDDEASKLQPPPSPAKNPVSAVLYITNLVRPFTLKHLKEMLSRTGTILENGFWTDKIKSKCYVQYANDEEAEATRNALHGVQWPINGKRLIIEYSTVECMDAARTATIAPEPVVVENPPEKVVEKVVDHHESKDQEERKREKVRATAPIREWDVGKVAQDRDRSNSRDKERERDRGRTEKIEKRRHSRNASPSNGEHVNRKKKKEEEVPAKLMDDLFHKTKAVPSIYWLPLTPEMIAKKQQQRLLRMAEHKRRLEESRRLERDFGNRGPPPRQRRRSGRFEAD